MTSSDYQRLKTFIEYGFLKSEKHDILNSLKDSYTNVINSPRRMEYIISINDLLNILEIRDILSEDNVSSLKLIAEELPFKNDLLNEIINYEEAHIKKELCNKYYASKPKSPYFQSAVQNSSQKHSNCEDLINKKLEIIHETIIKETGSFWRDLGRNLKIRECDIIEIDKNSHSLEEKTRNILEKFNEMVNPERWFFVLCNALEKSRRRDLSRSLQKIMAMERDAFLS